MSSNEQPVPEAEAADEQQSLLKETDQPSARFPTEAEVAEAHRYSQVTLRCTLVDMLVDLVLLTIMAIVLGPAIDRWLTGFSWLAGPQSLARVAVLGALITAIHSLVLLPVSFYSGFVVEHRFGLSTQSLGAWITNWFKRAGLTLGFLTLIYTGLFAIIWGTGGYWWLVAAGAFYLMSVVLGRLLPVLILPIFYKVDRLEDGAHTERLQRLADDAGLAVEGVFRLGMSAETSKANAMLAGVGATRRVLLGDTLLDHFSPAEIDIVFAHELGHHVHKHLTKLLALSAATAVIGFYCCHLVVAAGSGVADASEWPVAALPQLTLVLAVFSLVTGPLHNAVSRHFERQADRYAIDQTSDTAAFRSAFLKLAKMNKAELDPAPLEVLLLHSHPPIQERLRLVGAA